MMLTSHSDLETTVLGLEHYADDYMTKPFRYPELRARLNRLLVKAYEGGLHPGERVVIDERLSIDYDALTRMQAAFVGLDKQSG